MFSTFPKTSINLLETSISSSANALNLDRSKILPFGKGLRKTIMLSFLEINSCKNPDRWTEAHKHILQTDVLTTKSHSLQVGLTKNEVKPLLIYLSNQVQYPLTLRKRPLETIVGKGENAGSQHFLLLPQCFRPFQREIAPSEPQQNCPLQ